ncbi:MAG: hypothetical protein QOH28_3706 [Actinomycetota bacterium]|jgi:hypothetical protein|nr:hypothetical protein [Actinomycetota bacterium]
MAVIECQHCGVSIEVEADTGVRTGHNMTGGEARVWVMYARGAELHRCVEDVDTPNPAA